MNPSALNVDSLTVLDVDSRGKPPVVNPSALDVDSLTVLDVDSRGKPPVLFNPIALDVDSLTDLPHCLPPLYQTESAIQFQSARTQSVAMAVTE